jgi:integrase
LIYDVLNTDFLWYLLQFKLDKAHEGKAPDLTTEAELAKIHENAQEHLQWVIKVMINTGFRPGPTEFFAARLADVDYENEGIWIAREKTHGKRTLQPVKK